MKGAGTDGHHPADSTAHGPWSVNTVVLVPEGWNGSSAALPGYPMYYLNVMAGPHGEGARRITDNPAHAWVRETRAGRQTVSGAPLMEGTA